MSVKSWQRRFETLVVPLLDSAETLWNEIGVSEEQREKVLQRSASEQRNFFENIVAEAKLLRDRLQQENALLENELKSLGSELKLLIPSKPARLTLSETHEWLSREVEHVQVERARRNRQFLIQFAEYTFLRGLLDERGDSTLLEAYRDCVTSRLRVVSDSDTRKLGELVAALREERAVRATEFEALRAAVKETALILDLPSTNQHRDGNSHSDDVEELLSDEFVRDLLAFDVRSIHDPNFNEFVTKRLADANSNRVADEPFTFNDGNATVSFLRREQSITIGDELQTLPYLAAANLYTLRDARDRLTVAVNSNRERNDTLKRAIETIWDRLEVPADVRSQLVDSVGGNEVWQAISTQRDPSKGEPQVASGIASFRVRSALERALRELESAKRAQIPRIVQRIRSDLMARWSTLNLDAAAELAGLDAYVTESCGLSDVSHVRADLSEADRITEWCAVVRPDTLLEAHERAEAGWSEWFSHTERVHERIARWIDVFKRLVYCETDARRDPDYTTNRGGFILKLQKEVASMRKELGVLERTIGTLIAEYEATRQAAFNRGAKSSVVLGEQLLLTRTVLVFGKQFTDFAAEQYELLEAAKREFAASTKKGAAATAANPNATNLLGKTALLRLDVIAEENNVQQGVPPSTPKKRGANAAPSTSVTPKRGRLAASTISLAAQSQTSATTITVNPNTTTSSYSTNSSVSRTNLLALSKANSASQFSSSSSNLFRTHAKVANPAANQSRIPNAFNNSKLLSRSQMPLGGVRGNSASAQSSSRPGTKTQQPASRLPVPISRLNAGRSKLPVYVNSNTNTHQNQAAFLVPRSPSPDGGQRTMRVQEQRAKALNSKRRSRSFSDLRALQNEPMMVDEMTVVQESSMDSFSNTPIDAGVAQHSIGVGMTPSSLTRSGLGLRTNADGAMQRIRAAPSTSTLASISSGIGSSAGVPSANVTAFGVGAFQFSGRANAGVQTSIASENSSAFGDDRSSSITNGTAEDCSFVGSHGANSTKIEEALGMHSNDFSVSNAHDGQPSPSNAFAFALAPRANSGSSFLI